MLTSKGYFLNSSILILTKTVDLVMGFLYLLYNSNSSPRVVPSCSLSGSLRTYRYGIVTSNTKSSRPRPGSVCVRLFRWSLWDLLWEEILSDEVSYLIIVCSNQKFSVRVTNLCYFQVIWFAVWRLLLIWRII